MSCCVKQKGPVFTSAFTPLIQIFAAIFDVAVLHEEIYLGRSVFMLVCVYSLIRTYVCVLYRSMLYTYVSALDSIIGSIVVVLGMYGLLWGKSSDQETPTTDKNVAGQEPRN